MKNFLWLSAVCIFATMSAQAQIRIINSTSKQFTNLYFVSYGDSLKTKGVCDLIVNKNQLKTVLKSGKQSDIAVKLDPKKYYNLVLIDTSEYPNFYRHTTFKYYLPGSTRSITIKEENIESDFWGHCEEEIASRNLEDVDILVNNKSGGTLVKMYYKLESEKDFKRLKDLYQWDPVYKNTTRMIRLYEVKSNDDKKIFLKYFIEKKGIISEQLFETEFKEGSNKIELTIQ